MLVLLLLARAQALLLLLVLVPARSARGGGPFGQDFGEQPQRLSLVWSACAHGACSAVRPRPFRCQEKKRRAGGQREEEGVLPLKKKRKW